MAVSIFTVLLSHYHGQFQNIFIIPKGSPVCLSYSPLSPQSLASSVLATTDLPSVSIDFHLDILYLWNHIICALLCQAFFTCLNVVKVHPCYSVYQNFISFYDQVIFHCIDMPPLVFHVSAEGRLGCFHLYFFLCVRQCVEFQHRHLTMRPTSLSWKHGWMKKTWSIWDSEKPCSVCVEVMPEREATGLERSLWWQVKGVSRTKAQRWLTFPQR